MKGMGQAQELAIIKAKNKVFSFIRVNQPVTYKKIQNFSHVRRNNVRRHIDELINEKKITKIENLFFINPIPKDILKRFQDRQMIKTIIFNNQRTIVEIQNLFLKIIHISEDEPLRAKIVSEKISFHPNPSNIKKIEKEFHDFSIHNISNGNWKEFLDGYKNFIKTSKEFLSEWALRFRLTPRFEYPRLKNPYDNPYGIHPKFKNKNGSLNLLKIESIYRIGIFFGCCPSCNSYIAHRMDPIFNLQIKLNKGKISQNEFEEKLTVLKKNKTHFEIIPEKNLDCPQEFRFLGTPLPKDLIKKKDI